MVKVNFAPIIARINFWCIQKSVNILSAKPKSKPLIHRHITWNNFPVHFPENPIINNSNLGSSVRWCKKILSIVKTYMICESTSVYSSFKKSNMALGLEILTKSTRYIRSRHNNSYSDLISFRIKLLSGTLPTRKLLNQLYPDQYPDQICPRCELATEDIQHVFECYKAETHALQIINQINFLLQPDASHKPINQIWQVIELSCGIINNIFSVSDTITWTKAATEVLKLTYELI